MSSGRAAAIGKNLALSVASLVTFLLLAELLLTPFYGKSLAPTPGITDPFVGFRVRPNLVWTEAGGAAVRTNSHGLREHEIPFRRPAGGLRILCLGDSSTFGYGVRPEETYVKDLERRLRARFPWRPIEVINAGTPGWDSANGAAFLAREGLAWKPDVVVISFGYNEQLGAGPGAPHYDYDPRLRRVWFHSLGETVRTLVSQSPSEKTPRAEGFLDRFKQFPRHLRLYHLTEDLVRRAQGWIGRLLGWVKGSAPARWMLRALYKRNPEWIHARLRVSARDEHVEKAYVTNLDEMIRMSRQEGARPVILLQPRKAYREFLDLLPEKARRANIEAVRLLQENKLSAAISLLEAQRAVRPRDAITIFNLAVAYRMAGRSTDAKEALARIVTLRPFTLNVLAERTAARLGVPVVYTPLAFELSDDPSLFFPDRYHTRPGGYVIVANEVEKVLQHAGYLGNERERRSIEGSGGDPLPSPNYGAGLGAGSSAGSRGSSREIR